MDVEMDTERMPGLNPFVRAFFVRLEGSRSLSVPKDAVQPRSGSFEAIRHDHALTRFAKLSLSSSDVPGLRTRN